MVWKKVTPFCINQWIPYTLLEFTKSYDKVTFQWLTQYSLWRWVHNHCWSMIYLFIKNHLCLKTKNCFIDIFLRWYTSHLDNLILLCFSSQRILVFYIILSQSLPNISHQIVLYNDQTTYQDNNHTKMSNKRHLDATMQAMFSIDCTYNALQAHVLESLQVSFMDSNKWFTVPFEDMLLTSQLYILKMVSITLHAVFCSYFSY